MEQFDGFFPSPKMDHKEREFFEMHQWGADTSELEAKRKKQDEKELNRRRYF